MQPPRPVADPPAADPWSAHALRVGEARRWRIGPLTLWAARMAREWRVAYATGADAVDETLEVAVPMDLETFPEEGSGASLVRFSFGKPPSRIGLAPRLADRAVIARPAHPMTVPSGETAVLYVSTPLWVSVGTEAPSHPLVELPCFRPSDTWFGPSTVVGELCYASRTAGRLELDDLPLRPHRAVTPVRIRNAARDALQVERVKIPVELLSLHATERGLWTPQITLVREEGIAGGGDLANLQIAKKPPAEAGRSTMAAPPRTRSEGPLGLRAFSRLLGLGSSQ